MAIQTPRTMTKEITVSEKTFELRKMPPWTAMYIAKIVASKCVPILSLLDVTGEDESKLDSSKIIDGILQNAPAILDAISEDDLQLLMTRCLSYVNATYMKMKRPVYEDSYFTDPEIEADFPTCIKLVFEEVVFNCSSFFEGNGSILDKLRAEITSQQKP